MQEILDIKNKKQFIIDRYIENANTDFEQYELNKAYVGSVIADYRKLISVSYEMWCEKSMDLEDTWYLFTNGEEKMLKVEEGLIINCDILTDYEKRWLDVNKGWKI